MMAALLLLAVMTAQAPQDPAATVTAVRQLASAKSWDAFDARVESIPPDDPAWERLPQVVYQAGIERKDLPSVIDRLARVAGATTSPAIKASAFIVIGRAYRRQGDLTAATSALERAAAAPGTPAAEQATGIIYEITHLSPGLQAPPIDARARNGRSISLAALRGRPVVLVFWGTS